MIDFKFDKECCGCAACVDVCPKRCITLVEQENGFVVPSINKINCIECHKCEKVCPILNPSRIKFDRRKCFSAKNNDENQRKAGSSGSIFFLLAENVIKQGGVVYGAAFDEKLRLCHVYAETPEQLRPLLKSKYLQSSTTGVYKSVSQHLKTGRKVLFVGTPCQCNALYKTLGQKKPDNLQLVDFICHGVPSQKLFDDAIQHYEKKHKCKITAFEFRHKRPDCVHYFFLKGKRNGKNWGGSYDCSEFEVNERFDKFPFYNGFKRYLCFRESCYHCKFAVQERVADLTLADFWNIEKIDPSIDIQEFNKGYSMVITNSNKGEEIFMTLNDRANIKECDLENAVIYNSAYVKPVNDNFGSKSFRFIYSKCKYPIVEFIFFSKFYSGMNRIISILSPK